MSDKGVLLGALTAVLILLAGQSIACQPTNEEIEAFLSAVDQARAQDEAEAFWYPLLDLEGDAKSDGEKPMKGEL